MDPLLSSSKPSFWSAFVIKTKKFLKWLLILIVVIGISSIYWKYFYTYSEGYRAGLLQKFSHKGAIFKTYEGEIILSSVSNKTLMRQFDTLQGLSVIVHYRQKNAPVFWRGDSPYLVDSVKVRR